MEQNLEVWNYTVGWFEKETIWRSIILFGKNTASYKFSLAKGILNLAKIGKSVVSYEELAQAYTPHLLKHYKSGFSDSNKDTLNEISDTLNFWIE